MRKTILIVDDNKMNRILLRKILTEEYDVLEAVGGDGALTILRERPYQISAVLLDLFMPDPDGFEVIRQMQADHMLRPIPVIVITGSTDVGTEVRALRCGAHDFISKPYKPALILQRLRNTIGFRETAALVNTLRWDDLTGLYSRQGFFDKAREMVSAHEAGHYILAALDIDNFKVINDQYGSEMGDAVLRHVATTLRTGIESVDGVCCRITADKFAVLYPRASLHSKELAEYRRNANAVEGLSQPISLTTGRYIVSDLNLSISAMYDRASIAADSIKGRVDVQAAQYDESMRSQLLLEQEIVNEMNDALRSGQFEVWYQPQYNHSTGALVGAEALVRWRHPSKGMISPGLFVPVFERNGFIFELDRFVWECVCANLRKWLDAARSPLPVSVNVSRHDLLCDSFFDDLTGLLERYKLPASLLRLEITESAFAQDAKRLIVIVKRLSEYGFTVEIDDFGSGYSSLNTLKDVPADVLKLDMRFLENTDNMQRGGNILQSVVRMAKWLGMPVIAEGVETQEQADFLETIGCNYIQGYLYSKPLPVEEYERLAKRVTKEEKMLALVTVENLDNNAFWDSKSMDTLIFNSYIGGACIFEFHNGVTELLRVNRRYAEVLSGSLHLTIADALKINLIDHMNEVNRLLLLQAIHKAIRTNEEVSCDAEYASVAGCKGDTYLRARMRVIARANDRYLFYCTLENLTAQHEAEQRAFETAERLQAIMDSVGSGITALTLHGDQVRFIFVNDAYYEMLGYTRRQYTDEVRNLFDVIHPDDRAMALRRAKEVSWTGQTASIEYRAICRDGREIWLRSIVSLMRFTGVEDEVQLGITRDITAERLAQKRIINTSIQLEAILNSVHGGVSAATIEASGEVSYLFANDEYYALFGYTREQFHQELPEAILSLIDPQDAPLVLKTAEECARTNQPVRFEFRAKTRNGSVVWIRSSSSVCRIIGVDAPVHIAVLNDVTREKENARMLKESAERIRALNSDLLLLMNDTPGGFVRVGVDGLGGMRVLYVNNGLLERLGITRDAMMRSGDMLGGVHPDDRERVRDAIRQTIDGEEPMNLKCRLRDQHADYRWMSVVGRRTVNGYGERFLNLYFADLNDREHE